MRILDFRVRPRTKYFYRELVPEVIPAYRKYISVFHIEKRLSLTSFEESIQEMNEAGITEAVIFGGNVSSEVIGPERFRSFILPHYDALAALLHERGKLLGVHFDADTKAFARDIAESRIDFIEAFTPSPDTDMSVTEARSFWKEKALWINFPSSVHLAGPDVVEETTRSILRDAGSGKGLLI